MTNKQTNNNNKRDKPYRCEPCGKCFSRKSNLNQHVKAMHAEWLRLHGGAAGHQR